MMMSIFRKSPVSPSSLGFTEDEFVSPSSGAVTTTRSTVGSVSCATAFNSQLFVIKTVAHSGATTLINPARIYLPVNRRPATLRGQKKRAGSHLAKPRGSIHLTDEHARRTRRREPILLGTHRGEVFNRIAAAGHHSGRLRDRCGHCWCDDGVPRRVRKPIHCPHR